MFVIIKHLPGTKLKENFVRLGCSAPLQKVLTF